MNPLIINRPELQSPRQRLIYPIITFIFWVLWVYIWLPLISLIAWGFGVQLFYDEMILQNGLEAIIELASTYGLVIFILGLSLISWALYNWGRFNKKERRSGARELSTEDQASYFHLNAQELAIWKESKHLVVNYNEQGEIEQVRTKKSVSV